MSSESSAYVAIADDRRVDQMIIDTGGSGGAANTTLQEPPVQILFHVGMTLEEVERQMLFKTLAFFNYHKPKTAQVLGISLKTVYNRLARFGHGDNAPESASIGG